MGSAREDDETLGLQFALRSRNALEQFTSLLFHRAQVPLMLQKQKRKPRF